MYHYYYDLYFTTATILEWKHLLRSDKTKDIVIESLRFLVRDNRAVIYAFVIMPNHIHLIWHIRQEHTLSQVKGALLSYTAHRFKKLLSAEAPLELAQYKVELADREYQFWERNPLSIAIYHEQVWFQKAQYVAMNPCKEKWGLATKPEDYKYSSHYQVEGAPYWDFVAYDKAG